MLRDWSIRFYLRGLIWFDLKLIVLFLVLLDMLTSQIIALQQFVFKIDTSGLTKRWLLQYTLYAHPPRIFHRFDLPILLLPSDKRDEGSDYRFWGLVLRVSTNLSLEGLEDFVWPTSLHFVIPDFFLHSTYVGTTPRTDPRRFIPGMTKKYEVLHSCMRRITYAGLCQAHTDTSGHHVS